MRRFLILLLFAVAVASARAEFHAQYIFEHFQQGSNGVKSVTLTPLWNITTFGTTNLVPGDERTKATTAAGFVTFSNMIPGAYKVKFMGPTKPTYFTNFFGTNVTGLVNAADPAYLAPGTNMPGSSDFAYSQAAADARFTYRGGDTMTGGLTNNTRFAGNGAGLTNISSVNRLNVTNVLESFLSANGDGTVASIVASLNAGGAYILDNLGIRGLSVTPTRVIVSNNLVWSGAGTGNGSGITNIPGTAITSAVAASTTATTLVISAVTTNQTLGGATATNGLTVTSPGGGGSFVIGSPGQVGMHPYFGWTLITYDTLGFLVQDLSGYKIQTMGWNDRVGSRERGVVRTYGVTGSKVDAAYDLNAGAFATTYDDALAGNGAPLANLPAGGNSIWANQRRPYVVVTSRGVGAANNLVLCTESNMWSSITTFRSNGLLAAFTNNGINVAYDIENGWLTNHRAGKLLAFMTNRWPTAMTQPTNISYRLATNNIETWFTLYADTIVASNNNTELDINPLGGGFTYWNYPNGANPLGSVEIQPIIDGNSVNLDVSTFYSWGASGLNIQDSGNFNQAGYQQQIHRSFAYASLYPADTNGNAMKPYKEWYPNAKHGMILNFLIGTVGIPFPLGSEPFANGFSVESGGTATEPTGSGVLGSFIGAFRSHIATITNWQSGSVFPILQTDELQAMNAYTSNDWRGYLSGIGTFHAPMWLTWPHHEYCTNVFFKIQATNAGFMKAWQDPLQARPKVQSFGTNNGVFTVQQADPGTYLVWMFNESTNAATNLTVSFVPIGLPTNTVCSVADNWTGTQFGSFTNSYTTSVGTTGTVWLLITARDQAINLPLVAVTNGGPATLSSISFTNGGATFSMSNTCVNIATPGAPSAMIIQPNGYITAGGNFSGGRAVWTVYQDNPASTYTFDIAGHILIGRGTNTAGSTDGLLYIYGDQSGANGVAMGGPNGEYFRATPTAINLTNIFNRGVYQQATNALSTWPTSANTPGGFAIVNSNSIPHMLVSGPGSTTWTSTNRMVP